MSVLTGWHPPGLLVYQQKVTYRRNDNSLFYFVKSNMVRVTRSLVLYVCFVDRCLFFCTFSFGYCVVCSSSIYGLWLPLWYLQTRLTYSYVY